MAEENTTTNMQSPDEKPGLRKKFETRFRWAAIILGHPQARIGVLIISLLLAMAIFAPFIAPGEPGGFVAIPNQKPNSEYYLGTDPMGRNEFALVVWGARESLMIGFGTGLVAMIVATVVGLSAGYFGGLVDDVISLIMNLFLVIPALPILILLAAYLSMTTPTVVFTLAFTGWAFHARILRAQTLSLREKDYVAAAIVAGEKPFTIIFRYILPNLINLIVGGFLGTTIYGIATSTALAFLGLTDLEAISWGTNLFWAQNGNSLLLGAWWVFVPSGLCVALSALGLAWINYGMDEITNPRLKSERELQKLLRGTKFQRVRATPVMRKEH